MSLHDPRVSDGSAEKAQGTRLSVAPVGVKNKAARHCKRFWWIYVTLAVLVIILVPVLVICVAIPKIMQNRVNDSTLTISRIEMSNTTADSFVLAVDSSISTPGSIHADISPFIAELYLDGDDTSFGNVTFPKSRSSKNTSTSLEQIVPIASIAALTKFNTYLLGAETLKLRVKGHPKLKLKGLARHYKMNFNKAVELKGLNTFKGLTITDAAISLASTNNFKATVNVPNPSILTLDIGNTTFTNLFNGTNLGNVFIPDLILRPGNNSFAANATIEQTPVLTAIQTEPYCESGVMPFSMLGNSVINNGQNITYFRDALAAAPLPVSIDVGSALSAIGLDVGCSSKSSTTTSSASSSTATSS